MILYHGEKVTHVAGAYYFRLWNTYISFMYSGHCGRLHFLRSLGVAAARLNQEDVTSLVPGKVCLLQFQLFSKQCNLQPFSAVTKHSSLLCLLQQFTEYCSPKHSLPTFLYMLEWWIILQSPLLHNVSNAVFLVDQFTSSCKVKKPHSLRQFLQGQSSELGTLLFCAPLLIWICYWILATIYHKFHWLGKVLSRVCILDKSPVAIFCGISKPI